MLWKNVTPELMPNLYRFVGDAAGANIVVRTVGETTCPNEGWLTVGAGQRATDAVRDCRSQGAPTLADESGVSDSTGADGAGADGAGADGAGADTARDSSYAVPQWETYLQSNRSSSFRARIGLLGSQLEGKALAAIGPGAALALADRAGTFRGAYADVPALPGSMEGTSAGDSDPGIAAAGNGYAEIAAGRDLVMVDLGSVRYPDVQMTHDASGASKRGSDSVVEKFLAAFRSAGEAPPEVEPQLAALDARFGALLEAIESVGDTSGAMPRIMVMSVGDSQNSVPQLGFFAMRDAGVTGSGGPDSSGAAGATNPSSDEGDGAGVVVAGDGESATGAAQIATSDATRQWGLVQLTDVFPTILGSVKPDASALVTAVGAEIRDRGETFEDGRADELAARLADDQIRSEVVRPLVGPFYVLIFFVLAALIIVGWRVVRREPGSETPRWLPAAAAWSASLPVASLLVNLLPWWRVAIPGVALFGGIAVIAGVIAVVGILIPELPRGEPRNFVTSQRAGATWVAAPAAIVGAVTALTLAVDVLLQFRFNGYSLQLASLLAMQPQVGGRFYGLGNTTFAICLTGMLFASAYVVARATRAGRPRAGLFVAVAVGIATAILDGSGKLGADFGGPPAIVTGTLLLVLLSAGIRLTPLRLLGILVAAGLTSVVFAFIDFMSLPQERSHLGSFIQQIADGGGFEIVTRKISLALFGLPWWLTVVFFAAAFVLGAHWWRKRSLKILPPATTIGVVAWRECAPLRHTVIAISSSMFIGMSMNDSGVAIPFMGFAVAVPLWLIMVLRHNEGAR